VAVMFLAVKSLSRRAGQSAVAAAAYRTASRLTDERTGRVADYTRRGGVLATGVAGWRGDRSALWNAAEAAERRKDAMVAREVLLALPHELDPAARARIVAAYAQWLHRRHGVAVEWAIHAPAAGGDARAFHAHLLLTTRRVEADGRLGAKTRELDEAPRSRHQVEAWRRRWAELANQALREAGAADRLDHRSYRRQAEADGLPELLPQVKEGPRGMRRRPLDWAARARRINAARAALNAPARELRRALARSAAALIDAAAR